MARRGAEFWRRHLDAFYRGDLTQKDYCVQQQLSEKTFYRWRRKEAMASEGKMTLVPVSVVNSPEDRVVSLHSPRGWRVDIAHGDACWIAELLTHLS